MKTTILILISIVLLAAGRSHAQESSLPVTAAQQKALTPKSVLADLLEGNWRYAEGNLMNPNVKARIKASVNGQYPKAVILSCLDSRVPVELVFDQGLGDIFVGRVAGNIENEDQLGSMEFATILSGAKLVMVLGHESCGAVKGACDNARLGNLTAVLKRIQPAVDAVKGFDNKDRTSSNVEFVEKVAEQNVRQTVADIRKRSKVLAKMEKDGEIKIVGAFYSLQTGKVSLIE